MLIETNHNKEDKSKVYRHSVMKLILFDWFHKHAENEARVRIKNLSIVSAIILLQFD